MINITTKQNVMPEQPIETRITNYSEIKLGYTPEQAISEAMRCLNCRMKPCMRSGCPLHNNIPEFIGAVAKGDFVGAHDILTKTTRMSAICGRVCPHENQCEGHCVRGKKGEPVKIGALERFVADWYRENVGFSKKPGRPNGHKVAIIGAGPAGLACACDLNLMGYEVTVFDETNVIGGTMNFGIPEYRLPKSVIKGEVDALKKRGIEFVLNTKVGVDGDCTVKEMLNDGYEAIFISDGAVKPTKIDIESNEKQNIFDATDYLRRINVDHAYQGDSERPLPVGKKVVVIGGGNVAMDASRCAIRSGAEEVSIVYRRIESEMPALDAELRDAKEEGVKIIDLANPIAILKDSEGKVKGLECLKQKLGAPDESGRHKPVPVEGSNFIVDCDMVILATGTTFRPGITDEDLPDLKKSRKGAIVTDSVTATNVEGIYAGGDTVTGPATVVKAMGAGKQAAISIDRYIFGFEK